MADPTDPPRPTLTSTVRNFLAACTWNTQTGRVEDAQGNPVSAWLAMTGNPGLTVTVEWRAAKTSNVGADAIKVTIRQSALNVIKNGTHDATSGLITHNGNDFCFMIIAGANAPEMKESAI